MLSAVEVELSVFKVVPQKSIPTQICQLILYIRHSEGEVIGFVRELTYAKRLCKHILGDKVGLQIPWPLVGCVLSAVEAEFDGLCSS